MLAKPPVLKYTGHRFFDIRICTAVLARRPIVIDRIRDDDEAPGLTDGEVLLLRLIERLTNNTTVRINITGTRVFVKPGIIIGGSFTFDTSAHRSMGYYIPSILLLSAFSKQPTEVVLSGITDGLDDDPSVEYFVQSIVPLVQQFGLDFARIQVKSRGFPPLGGGEVIVSGRPVRELTPISYLKRGEIKQVRGTVTACRISPAVPSRLILTAREQLSQKFSDVYISTNHVKGAEAGRSPGASICLTAESKKGSLLSVWASLGPGQAPEELSELAGKKLRHLVKQGGVIDSHAQPWTLLLMLFCKTSRSTVKLSHVSRRGLEVISLAQSTFGINFEIKEESDHVLVSVLGLGLPNYARVSC
ncbi:hypothetical protein P9112_012938 [Eukaryota sp. TZLM1-RC]